MKKIRLFVEVPKLASFQLFQVTGQDFEYLTKVMRQKVGAQIFIFNNCDGEFSAKIVAIDKKNLTLEVQEKIAALQKASNVTLAFALIKNVKIDFIATKATELGVARFQPLITNHSIVDKINYDRFKINVKEACEQCERNDFPEILSLKKLSDFLDDAKNSQKILLLCDESGQGRKAQEILPEIAKSNSGKEIVVFIGPEGGFSTEEFAKFRSFSNLYALSLGPRILRADTAIIAALTLVQEFL